MNAHKGTAGSDRPMDVTSSERNSNSAKGIRKTYVGEENKFEAQGCRAITPTTTCKVFMPCHDDVVLKPSHVHKSCNHIQTH